MIVDNVVQGLTQRFHTPYMCAWVGCHYACTCAAESYVAIPPHHMSVLAKQYLSGQSILQEI